jgi:anti-sigma factor RsiW
MMTSPLTDIVSTDEHNVKPWFDGKVAFAPDVPRLDSAGFPLIGGRVDTVGREPAAALVYGRRKHLINLFTWPASRGARTSDEILSATEHGYNVLRWVRGDMQFAAVSDLAMIDLRQFVEAFRQSRPASGADAEHPRR